MKGGASLGKDKSSKVIKEFIRRLEEMSGCQGVRFLNEILYIL